MLPLLSLSEGIFHLTAHQSKDLTRWISGRTGSYAEEMVLDDVAEGNPAYQQPSHGAKSGLVADYISCEEEYDQMLKEGWLHRISHRQKK
mmetsp:Transcript_19638/g.28585  ORF Transcript_19638/g.28585 Transcript_19638/m.28585 type:complete len:90 (-) Transcript_19638:1067-1336(-)